MTTIILIAQLRRNVANLRLLCDVRSAPDRNTACHFSRLPALLEAKLLL